MDRPESEEKLATREKPGKQKEHPPQSKKPDKQQPRTGLCDRPLPPRNKKHLVMIIIIVIIVRDLVKSRWGKRR